MVTKGIDIGDQREGQREDLGDKNNDLDDQRKYLNESKVAMPQRVKQNRLGNAQPAARRA